MTQIVTPLPDVPERESADPKEVFSFFGLAAFNAQVLEQSVLHLAVLTHLADSTSLSRGAVLALFEGFDRATLGRLLHAVGSRMTLGPSLAELLARALETRNALAHRFFAENAVQFKSEAGRIVMIDQLRDWTRLFLHAERESDRLFGNMAKIAGIPEQAVDEFVHAVEMGTSS